MATPDAGRGRKDPPEPPGSRTSGSRMREDRFLLLSAPPPVRGPCCGRSRGAQQPQAPPDRSYISREILAWGLGGPPCRNLPWTQPPKRPQCPPRPTVPQLSHQHNTFTLSSQSHCDTVFQVGKLRVRTETWPQAQLAWWGAINPQAKWWVDRPVAGPGQTPVEPGYCLGP